MWTPQISPGPEPVYRRVADAMAADIGAGRLAVGDKLPPQRDLAYRLGLGIGTITRAYDEAVARGLIVAHVGRGSFVAGSVARQPGEMINLALNICPSGPAASRVSTALAQVRKRADLLDRLNYSPPLGLEADRRAGARWLAQIGGLANPDWRRTACCLGAQQAMGLVVRAVAKPGDTILCEESTYAGMVALARDLGFRLQGVKMDGEGMDPAALERAIAETGARMLYTVPTLHNPTARIMGMARRQNIADIARAHDLTVIEDDIYAHFVADMGLHPLANLMPERTWYIGGISKAVAPGLRAGYLVAPQAAALDRIASAIRATTNAAPGLTMGIATHWIESGAAGEIVAEVVAEIAARAQIASDCLGDRIAPHACRASHHFWMPMPALEAERAVAQAARAGIALMTPSLMMVSPDAEPGLRVSLGAAADRDQLAEALTSLRMILSGSMDAQALAAI